MKIELAPIGYVRSPFKDLGGIPIQTRRGNDFTGEVEVLEEFAEGLADLDGFSHIILLSYLHRSEGYDLKVVPFLDNVERGVFSTRAPRRPNPIGLHVVKLEGVGGNILRIRGIDMVDGTPVLDIKPYIPHDDADLKLGWLEGKLEEFDSKLSDGRFSRSSPR
ncbi:MAG: tRNA (N6-threonylcarbamoyladenosine(37)-N6)-methyltransferase TrmO [Thermoplasmatota archaeon]